ncbi:MAG: hypothetical protein J6W16_02755 [Methanobrevibacter sp.]|nr:hypothetical protein [Methanobrevibacter sp.]
MRLWHQSLIPYLDNKRLCAQHRECCALRGKGWGRKHATVDYVFKYDVGHLFQYHLMVMCEMNNRGYYVSVSWYDRLYRGKNLSSAQLSEVGTYLYKRQDKQLIYPEHDDRYLKECLLNLKSKGAELVNGKTIEEMLIKLDLNENV